MAEILSSLVQLGWFVLASVFLFRLFPAIRDKLANVSRVTVDKSGKVVLDIKQEVEEVLAAHEVDAQQEAFPPEDRTPIGRRLVIWSTGGDQRAAGPIAVLKDAGFRVEEIEPQNLLKSELLEREDIAAIVTNLKHGSNYNGGSDMVAALRSDAIDCPVVLFTSQTAVSRRAKHIDAIGVDYVATDSGELVQSVVNASNA